MPARRSYLAQSRSGADTRPGIQSIEIGIRLLSVLIDARTPLGLSDIAARCGMHRSKAHRYFVSLCRSGLAEQEDSGEYRLGPLALRMGMVVLGNINPVTVARPHLERLAAELRQTVALCLWADQGPTYIEWKGSVNQVSLSIPLGAPMPLLNSAAGRLFCAYLPPERLQPFLDSELRAAVRARSGDKGGGDAATLRKSMEKTLAEVRTQGLSRVRGTFQSGISALSAPIFDHRGELVLGLTSLAPTTVFDANYDGIVGKELRRVAAGVSRQLGFSREQKVAAVR